MTSPRCPHCGGPVNWQVISDGAGGQVPGSYDCEQGGDCPGIQAKLAQGLPLTERCVNGHTAVRLMVRTDAPGQDQDAWVPTEPVCTKGDLCETARLMAEGQHLLDLHQQRMMRPSLLTRLLRRLRKLTRGDKG